MSLKSEREPFRASCAVRLTHEIQNAVARAGVAAAASVLLKNAMRAGDRVPDFRLPSARGGWVRMADLLAKGSVVLSFYRGGWCPYCRRELQALQAVLPRIIELGAGLVAISSDSPDESLSTATQNGISFAVLSDFDSAIAKSCGIAFEVAEELRSVYGLATHPLPAGDGDGTCILPIPATYVVGRDGIIALAYLDVDYRNRLEPSDVLAALRALSQER